MGCYPTKKWLHIIIICVPKGIAIVEHKIFKCVEKMDEHEGVCPDILKFRRQAVNICYRCNTASLPEGRGGSSFTLGGRCTLVNSKPSELCLRQKIVSKQLIYYYRIMSAQNGHPNVPVVGHLGNMHGNWWLAVVLCTAIVIIIGRESVQHCNTIHVHLYKCSWESNVTSTFFISELSSYYTIPLAACAKTKTRTAKDLRGK